MTTTQLKPMKEKVETVRDLLEKLKPQLAMALPRHMTPDRVTRIALTSILRNPDLLECTPASLAGAILQASQLGLECDGVSGQAALIPFKRQVTFIPMYKGLLNLARRSGEVSTIEARVVHAKDKFHFTFGLKPTLVHVPTQEEDAGPLVAVYAIGRLKDGGCQWEVMWKREIDAIRKQSPAGGGGPWVSHYDEMAKKTVLRRLCKLLPSSPELQVAVSLDERAEAGIPQDLGMTIDATLAPEKPSALDQLADSLEAKKGAAPDNGDQQAQPEIPLPERSPVEEAMAVVATLTTAAGLLKYRQSLQEQFASWTGEEQVKFQFAYDSQLTAIKGKK